VLGVSYTRSQPFHRQVDRTHLPWRLQAEHSGGGIFMDIACHTLDILDYIFGPLEKVTGSASNVGSPYDVEDTVSMQFELPSGIPGKAAWSFASDDDIDQIAITGERGEVRLSTFGREPVELRTESGTTFYDIANPLHIEQPMIETVVAELLGRGRCESTAVSGARTAAVMDQVLAGYYGTRATGFWGDPSTWPGRRKQA
jgi:predicted dehydrogenase